MVLIEWTDDWSVGYEPIDGDHKKLFELINQLHDAIARGEGQTAVSRILVDLIDYTGYHFSREEEFMRVRNYPQYGAHKKRHVDLIERVTAFQTRLDQGDLDLAPALLEFLKLWLKDHIHEIDIQLGEFLAEAGG